MSGLEGLLTGRVLVDRYRIEEVIGRGGFAAVYSATDERLGRPVAVKVITYPAPDAETRESLRRRFQREARAAASLPQHPNVVTVHDFGTDPALGMDFLVMELLDGVNLATHLAQHGRPPLDEALCILRDATEGLSIGHRAGLVHRDVKPGNIFLARTHGDDAFRVCVLDFGIAQVVADDGAGANLTRTGFVPHSPAYASPEQMRGVGQLTPATDVFSLGVVGYQLLTAERPFGAEPRTSPADWTPARPIQELNPSVPPAVVAVVERALAFEPVERFADAGEMAEALRAAMGEQDRTIAVPVAAPVIDAEPTLVQPLPAPAAPRAPAPVARRRAVPGWALGGIAAAALALAAVWALGGSGGPGDRGPGEQAAGIADTLVTPNGAGSPSPSSEAEDAASEPSAPPTTRSADASAPGGSPIPAAGGAPPAETAQTAAQERGIPARTPPTAQPGTQRPQQDPARPAQPTPAQPAPQPAPAQPAPPAATQPDTAARQQPAPRLLGKPTEQRPPPKPDSTAAPRDSTATGAPPGGR